MNPKPSPEPVFSSSTAAAAEALLADRPMADAALAHSSADRTVGVAAGLAAGALWGLVFVAPRLVPQHGGVALTAGRFLVYGLVAALVMMLTWRRLTLPTPRQALAAAGFSLLGFTGYYLLLVFAIRDAGSEIPTLIIGTIPLALMLLGKPEGLRWGSLLPAVALTVTGLGLMMFASGGVSRADAALPHLLRGVLLAFGAMASWTAFALGSAAWLKRHPDVDATAWTNWLGVAAGLGGALLWAVAGPEVEHVAAQPDRWLFVAVCLATGAGAGWLATVLWTVASTRLSPSLCGQLIVSETLFGLLFSFLWDGRPPSSMELVACVFFTLGIVASIRAHR